MRLFLVLLGLTGLGSPLIANEAPTLLPGRQVPDVAFTDLTGKPHRLANASATRAWRSHCRARPVR